MRTSRKGEPVSRRERPAKAPLTRQGTIDAALTILREEGLAKVTMRRIAAALDTGPASLYVYVRNTEDLHAQILDALLGSLRKKAPKQRSWQDRLKELLTRYARVLFDHPEIALMALSTQPSGPNYLALVDGLLGLLHEGRVPDREAAWGVDALLLLATANAAEHGAPRPTAARDAEGLAHALESAKANPTSYPHIARLGDELVSGPGPDRFTFSVDVLLAGLVTARRKPSF